MNLSGVLAHLVLGQNVTAPLAIGVLPTGHGPTVASKRDVKVIVLGVDDGADRAGSGLGGRREGDELLAWGRLCGIWRRRAGHGGSHSYWGLANLVVEVGVAEVSHGRREGLTLWIESRRH